VELKAYTDTEKEKQISILYCVLNPPEEPLWKLHRN